MPGELTRQLAFTNQPVRMYHYCDYCDRDQYEVDAILESPRAELVACEVKVAETVRSEDFRGNPTADPPPQRPRPGCR